MCRIYSFFHLIFTKNNVILVLSVNNYVEFSDIDELENTETVSERLVSEIF